MNCFIVELFDCWAQYQGPSTIKQFNHPYYPTAASRHTALFYIACANILAMFKLEDVLLLKDDEEIRAITRQHGLMLVPMLLLALLLIVGPFFFLFPLFSSGPAGILMFGVLVLVGMFIALRKFVMWDGDVFIVTNQRIVNVDQKGMFSRTVSEVKLDDIHDASWSKRGIVHTVFNLGNVLVQGSSLTLETESIPGPKDLHGLINDLRHAMKPKRVDLAPQRAAVIKHITSQLESLDDTTLTDLDQTLKHDDRDLTIKKLFGEEGENGSLPADHSQKSDDRDMTITKLFGEEGENGLKPMDDAA
jgi:hypothetical protein